MQNIQGIGCACRLKIPFDQKVQRSGGDFGLDATVRLDDADFKRRQEHKKEWKKKKLLNLSRMYIQDDVFLGCCSRMPKANSVALARDFHRACWVNIERRGKELADPHTLY
jgi:hypothetical protein